MQPSTTKYQRHRLLPVWSKLRISAGVFFWLVSYKLDNKKKMLKNTFLFHTGLQVTWFFDVDWGVLLLWFRCNYFIVIFNNFSITLKRNDPTYLFSQRLFICQPATDIHNEPVVWKKSSHCFIDLIFTINTQIS